jgi:DNA polymerase-3 subunit delta'
MPFQDLVDLRVHLGRRRLVGLLARSVHRDTLPPSLIFSGPAGAGKRQTAIATAQALNCLSPTGEGESRDSCGTCTACMRIARGTHPDVLIVEPGDNGSIRIDQVRDAIDRAGYRPFEGRRRVVIIDQADAMMAAAQNALLKTLEEPPSSSVFILVTARPDMLLATVQSRCPRLRFPAAETDAVDADAREVAQRVLARVAASGEPLARIEASKDLLAGTGGSHTGAEDRAQVSSHLHAMASLLRDVELLSTRADTRGLANPDVRPELDRLTGAYDGERGLRAFTAVDRALMALDGNASVKIVADWLVLSL